VANIAEGTQLEGDRSHSCVSRRFVPFGQDLIGRTHPYISLHEESYFNAFRRGGFKG